MKRLEHGEFFGGFQLQAFCFVRYSVQVFSCDLVKLHRHKQPDTSWGCSCWHDVIGDGSVHIGEILASFLDIGRKWWHVVHLYWVWYRSGGGLVQVWWRSGAGLVQVWCRSGAGQVEVWCRSGAGQVEVWWRSGAGLVQVWCRSGAGLVEVWCRSGAGLVEVWCRSGAGLVQVRWRSGAGLVQVWWRSGAGLVEVRCRSGGGLVQVWCRSGAGQVEVWCRSGGGLVQVWWRSGAGLVEVWCRSGGGLVQVWCRSGAGQVEVRCRSGGGLVEVRWRSGAGLVEVWWRSGGGQVEVRCRSALLSDQWIFTKLHLCGREAQTQRKGWTEQNLLESFSCVWLRLTWATGRLEFPSGSIQFILWTRCFSNHTFFFISVLKDEIFCKWLQTSCLFIICHQPIGGEWHCCCFWMAKASRPRTADSTYWIFKPLLQ